jgi:hypothetical protein
VPQDQPFKGPVITIPAAIDFFTVFILFYGFFSSLFDSLQPPFVPQ